LAPNPFTQPAQNGNGVNTRETTSQAVPLRLVNVTEVKASDAEKEINTSSVGNDVRAIILRMYRAGDSLRKIAETVGLNGRHYKLFQAVCTELGIKKVEEA
jgi:hypothetical protein